MPQQLRGLGGGTCSSTRLRVPLLLRVYCSCSDARSPLRSMKTGGTSSPPGPSQQGFRVQAVLRQHFKMEGLDRGHLLAAGPWGLGCRVQGQQTPAQCESQHSSIPAGIVPRQSNDCPVWHADTPDRPSSMDLITGPQNATTAEEYHELRKPNARAFAPGMKTPETLRTLNAEMARAVFFVSAPPRT